MSIWLIPWNSRSHSGATDDNFLWKSGNLYVMDNHRLALWCWWQHLSDSAYWNFVHIDRHYDALWQDRNPWPENTKKSHAEDLSSFRSAAFNDDGEQFELYRWDVVTSALWSLHADQLHDIQFATAEEGDFPRIPQQIAIAPWKLPGLLDYLSEPVSHLEYPAIIDIDLDYFAMNDLDGVFGQVFSDGYIERIGQAVERGLQNGRFGVVTIAFSPETTGSWSLAEHIFERLGKEITSCEAFFRDVPRRLTE